MNKLNQVKIPVNIAKKVRLTKLSDDTFGGNHPNGINEGYVKEGYEFSTPKVGERYYIGAFSTSPITEIIDKNNFKSTYSTYRIEYIDEG